MNDARNLVNPNLDSVRQKLLSQRERFFQSLKCMNLFFQLLNFTSYLLPVLKVIQFLFIIP